MRSLEGIQESFLESVINTCILHGQGKLGSTEYTARLNRAKAKHTAELKSLVQDTIKTAEYETDLSYNTISFLVEEL